MQATYILKYVWSDLWHKANRPFTLINIIAIGLATAVLVILLGSFLAFRRNGEELMDRAGLGIEIHAAHGQIMSDSARQKLQTLAGISSIQWWTPTIFLFYSQQGKLCDGIRGRTVALQDPLLESLRDIRGQKNIKFLSKKELPDSSLDELGIIIPFIMLKQLAYLPQSATYHKPETWQNETLPDKIKILIKENTPGATPVDVELPVIGIVDDIEGGRYLLTKDCYRLFGYHWLNGFKPLLHDRYGKPLFPNAPAAGTEERELLANLLTYSDTHGTVYAQKPDIMLPLIKSIRSLEIKADCALENHLEGYEQQKSFFMAVAGGISVAMFFFSGVILFSTFKALILHKLKEIGILKACGASKSLVYALFALHVILLSGIASIAGMAVGAGGATYMGRFIQKQLEITGGQWFWLPSQYMVSMTLGTIAFCLLVTFFPVQAAAKLDPESVMRG